MATMSDDERDAFLSERRLGTLAIGRVGKAPLMAPIWYRYNVGGTIDIAMGADSAKTKRLRAEGRASMCVIEEGLPYKYVTVEGPIVIEALQGKQAEAEILEISTRYLGRKGGAHYTENFMKNLSSDNLHDQHGTEEVLVRITPEYWRTEVLR